MLFLHSNILPFVYSYSLYKIKIENHNILQIEIIYNIKIILIRMTLIELTKEESLIYERRQRYETIIKHFSNTWLIYLFGSLWIFSIIVFVSVYFVGYKNLPIDMLIFLGSLSLILLLIFLLVVFLHIRNKRKYEINKMVNSKPISGEVVY